MCGRETCTGQCDTHNLGRGGEGRGGEGRGGEGRGGEGRGGEGRGGEGRGGEERRGGGEERGRGGIILYCKSQVARLPHVSISLTLLERREWCHNGESRGVLISPE